MPLVTSWWPFFFFVLHGAMNRTCFVSLKIRTCRKLDAKCYYAVILSFGVRGEGFDSTSAPRLRRWF